MSDKRFPEELNNQGNVKNSIYFKHRLKLKEKYIEWTASNEKLIYLVLCRVEGCSSYALGIVAH